MNTTRLNTECIPQQIRVFSNWFSTVLSQTQTRMKVEDITKDLKNGVALIELTQVLIGKKASKECNTSPQGTEEIVKNNNLAIELLTQDGVHLKGISGKEVNESKEKFILGLVWTLILHYSIDKSIIFSNDFNKINDKTKFSSSSNVTHYIAEKHYKQALMQWALDCTENYQGINEFQPFSLSLCALLDFFYPDKINFYSLDPSNSEINSKIAIQTMNDLKIPVLFNVNDMKCSKIDDKALLTQLSVIKIAIEKLQPTHTIISKSRTLILDDEFIPHKEPGNNKRYAGKKFGLIMTLKETDFRNGEKIDPSKEQVMFGDDVLLALTLTNEKNPYLNPSGRMLSMSKPDIKNDLHQQFVFGNEDWNTVIDSIFQKGMVWDVADEFNPNPPAGTPFYVFPFHGRHNQHFIYKNGMICAQQNGHVVTYVGGSEPLIMMPPSKTLKARQTFRIQVI